MKMKKTLAALLAMVLVFGLTACGTKNAGETTTSVETTVATEATPSAETTAAEQEASQTRTIVDGNGREVEIPSTVESIVCVGVGALRYTCYVGGADLVVGVEDYETDESGSVFRLYNYVNFDKFRDLPVTGTNGTPFEEEIIKVDPQVIVMSAYASVDADELEAKTNIPVVVVPGSDTTLDDKAYETIRILGELYSLGFRRIWSSAPCPSPMTRNPAAMWAACPSRDTMALRAPRPTTAPLS